MQNSGSAHIFERVRELAAPLAASLGLQIWGLELGGGARPVLRIFVELDPQAKQNLEVERQSDPEFADLPEQSVDVDSLAHLSRLLGLGMEVEDIFPDAWTLEVSSPGLERPFFNLEQLQSYLGREIEASLLEPVNADPLRKKYRGQLQAVGQNGFCLSLNLPGAELDGENLEIPWRLVRKARLVHIFDDPEKPGKHRAKDKR